MNPTDISDHLISNTLPMGMINNGPVTPAPEVKKKAPRSLKACDRCKKKKQRCQMSLDVSVDVRCLTCQNLDIKCSLQDILQPQIPNFEEIDENLLPSVTLNAGEHGYQDKSANDHANATPVDGNKILKKILVDQKLESKTKKDGPAGKITKANPQASQRAISTSIYTQHYVNSFGTSALEDINKKVSKILEYIESNPGLIKAGSTSLNTINSISTGMAITGNAPTHNSSNNWSELSTSNTPGENTDTLNVISQNSTSQESLATSMIPASNAFEHTSSFSEEHLDRPEPSFLFSPFATFTRIVRKSNVPLQVRNLHDAGPIEEAGDTPRMEDVIDSNILTLPEVVMLVREFKDNYGTWVSFPEKVPVEDIVDSIRKSNCSVLLTTACVLALRYTVYYHDLKTRIYKNLLFKLKFDLERQIVLNDSSIEFIQSLVMMSIYSCSLSSDIQTFDSWSLSGMGIQFFISQNILNAFKSPQTGQFSGVGNSSGEAMLKQKIDRDEHIMFDRLRNHRLWNHLVLVHLTHSILGGRMSILNKKCLKKCFDCLDLPNATHFDGGMVAEISLYSIVYEYTQKFSEVKDLKEPLSVIDAWYTKWDYLTKQPTEQFVDFSYHFSYVLVIYMWYHHKRFPTMEAQRKRQSKKTKEQEQKEQDSFINANGKTAQRTFNGERLNKKFPLSDVYGSIPLETQKLMLNHCEIGLKMIVDVRIHNFRYLSDQLVFIAVYLSLITLKTLKNVCDEFPGELTPEYTSSMTSYVKQLSLKLRSIRESELKSFWVEEVDLRVPSVILQYHSALESYLKETFPDFVDPAKPL